MNASLPAARSGSHTRSRRAALLAVLSVLAASMACRADQILQIHTPSLTTYKTSTATQQQGIVPLPIQRAVGIDGSARTGMGYSWAFAGNPFGDAMSPVYRVGEVNLSTGAYSPTDIDLALPGPGASRIVIGRTFNGRQTVPSNGSHRSSNGYQGFNWQQLAVPELVYYSDGSDHANDVIYLIGRADGYLEFKRTSSSSDFYQARNGAAGVIERVQEYDDEIADDVDYYLYYDQAGTRTYFLGTLNIGTNYKYQLWKITDAAGNTSYVGDASSIGTAIDISGYDTNGHPEIMYDAAGRRYYFTYSVSTIGGNYRLEQVLVETDGGDGWDAKGADVLVAQVDYDYYSTTVNDTGLAGDLKTVKVTTPLTDDGDGNVLITNKYYRYYTRAWDNSDGRRGEAHEVKLVLGKQGWLSFEGADSNFGDDDIGAASDSALKEYSEAYLEYADTGGSWPYRISSAFFNGECGCGGGANGTYTFTYGDNGGFSPTSGYDVDWKNRAVAHQPDGTYCTYYFDEVGAPLSRVVTNSDPSGSPTKLWVTEVIRNSDGQVTEIDTPANNDNHASAGYDHSTGTYTRYSGTGLINLYARVGSGDETGLLEAVKFKLGTSGTAYFLSYTEYADHDLQVTSGVNVTRPVVTLRRTYPGTATAYNTSNTYNDTSYTYAWWSSTNTDVLYIGLQQVTTTLPAVSSGNNGSNASNTTDRYLRQDGTTAFSRAPDDVFDYMEYTSGQLTKSIRDVSTNGSFPSGDDPQGDFGIGDNAAHSNRITQYSYDPQGRQVTTTLPTGRIMENYYSVLADRRMVTLSWPRSVPGGSTARYGPASYSVTNHAGRTEFSGVVAAAGLTDPLSDWIDEADADPITALDKGTLKSMRTALFDYSGHEMTAQRAYFVIPASGAGSSGTNYDATTYVYDVMGRQSKSVSAAGTISKATFDEAGRAYRTYIGTDDSGTGSDNMVKTSELVYDGGSSGGNSYLTTRTLYVEGSTTGQRITTYTYDFRGRVLLSTNPQAPHVLSAYDNLGRVTATARYSTAPPSTASPTGTATDDKTYRTDISTASYDELGRVFESRRYEVSQSTGLVVQVAYVDEYIPSLTWYDPASRVMKTSNEGGIIKMRYDRLGRQIQSFTLATTDDSQYSHASASTAVFNTTTGKTSVAGDIVLEEDQTAYESTDSDNVLMRVSIMRHYNDLANGTTGELDLNADGGSAGTGTLQTLTAVDVKGRVDIQCTWYDAWDRPTDSLRLGTNAIVGDRSSTSNTYARGSHGSPPTRSSTELLTTTAYDTDGTVLSVTDPKALITQYEYDRLFRQTKVIHNYVNGSPSSDTADDDQTVQYAYSNGHRTSITAHLQSYDQVTTYIYGATKGTPSAMKIASGDLLRAVLYPDTSNTGTVFTDIDSDSSDVVSYAYNAQGQVTYTKDQAGNVIETDYDTAGRETARKATTIITPDFDDYVKRIETGYTGRGFVDTVTQYSATSSGTVRDQVQYAYDDWGNLASFTQDPDSAIGGASGRDEFSISYTYEKAAPSGGAVKLRRTGASYPGGSDLTYEYSSAANCLDDAASRVTDVKVGAVVVASYLGYTGPSMLVHTRLDEPAAHFDLTSGSPAYSDRLDRFNRTILSKWFVKGNGPSHDVSIAYDENSNITGVTDNLHKNSSAQRNHDVKYGYDSLNRLLTAEEGTLSGTISNRARNEEWTLDQAGNWTQHLVDYNGNNNYIDNVPPQEFTETRTNNAVNEIGTRELEYDSGHIGPEASYSPTYDANGNTIDDAKAYAYKPNPFGQIRFVYVTGTTDIVEELHYNGLGYLISRQYDANASGGDPDSSDPVFFYCYDERWRMLGTVRLANGGSASEAFKERFVYHAAGAGGYGGSSYIDAVILRDADKNTTHGAVNGWWQDAADGALENRVYDCQSWRADVSALLTDTGKLVEGVKYSSYGVPTGLPAGDIYASGQWTSAESGVITAAIGGAYDVRYDIDLDGDVDANDVAAANAVSGGYQTLGRGVLSSSSVANRKGYAGYEGDGVLLGSKEVVRHRWYDAEVGRWMQRDPWQYIDGCNLYQYAVASPLTHTDSLGTVASTGDGCDKCNQALKYLETDPRISNIRNLMRKNNCPLPTISCTTDLGPGTNGETTPPENCVGASTIKIKCRDADPIEYFLTIEHEHVHALDVCLQCKAGLHPDNCLEIICSEARARALVNCRNKTGQERAECIREGMEASICGDPGSPRSQGVCCKVLHDPAIKEWIQKCIDSPLATPPLDPPKPRVPPPLPGTTSPHPSFTDPPMACSNGCISTTAGE